MASWVAVGVYDAQWGILENGNYGIFSCVIYHSIRKPIYHNICEYLLSKFTQFSVTELLILLPNFSGIFFKNTDNVFK